MNVHLELRLDRLCNQLLLYSDLLLLKSHVSKVQTQGVVVYQPLQWFPGRRLESQGLSSCGGQCGAGGPVCVSVCVYVCGCAEDVLENQARDTAYTY